MPWLKRDMDRVQGYELSKRSSVARALWMQMLGDLQWPLLLDALKGEGFTHQSSGLQISSSELCGNAFNM